jgi:hypothetical protein
MGRPIPLLVSVFLNLLIGLSGLGVAGSLIAVVGGNVPAPPGMHVQGAAATVALIMGGYAFLAVVGAVGLWRRNRAGWLALLGLDGIGLAVLGFVTWLGGLDPIILLGFLVWGIAFLATAARPTRFAVSG